MPNPIEQSSLTSSPASPLPSSVDQTATPSTPNDEAPISPMISENDSHTTEVIMDVAKLPPAATLHGYVAKYAAATSRLISKGSKKWLGDSVDLYDRDPSDIIKGSREIYDFENRLDDDVHHNDDDDDDVILADDDRIFRRESNASLLVEAALNVAEFRGYNSGKCSPDLHEDSLQLPQDTALATHIRYLF